MKYDGALEKRLQGLSPKSPDSGHKERILRGAAERALARRILTPAWKRTVAACAVLLLVVFLSDGPISVTEVERLNALLEIPEQEERSLEQTIEAELAACREALPDLDKALLERFQAAFLNEKKAARTLHPYDRLEEVFYEN